MPSSPLINTYSISKSYGNNALFRDISLGFSSDERLGLIGPNGSGKSTFLKILAGIEAPDAGKIVQRQDTLIVYLPQKDQSNPGKTIEETLLYSISEGVIEAEHYRRVRAITQQAAFTNLDRKVETLSGGERKRLAIARALIQEPDLLLLDEPTNHLDVEGIVWLESLLQQAPFSFVLVSHDRYFLENTTHRVVELNKQYPEGFLKVEGNYTEFLQKREALINQQLQQEQVLSNRVRREREWLQRGPKARTSKAQYRLDNAQQIQEELTVAKARNAQNKTVGIDFEATYRKSKKLLEAQDIEMTRGGRRLFSQLNLQLSPGKCIGILGRNGSGKSSLVSLLKGDLTPDSGVIKWADGAQIVVFEQKREQLDPELTLKQALCPLGDRVTFQGRSLHVSSWAKRFLFPSERLAMPISQLSGGEQARVLIANLMLKSADILLLDEPTNDLDIPTLEVLEESLKDFPGAIVLITHDRFLLDRLSDILLYLDGKGRAEFFVDYPQWLKARESESLEKVSLDNTRVDKKAPSGLSYGERKELNRMDTRIAKAEAAVEMLQHQLYDPEIMSDSERLTVLYGQIQEAEDKIERLYERWEELEALNQSDRQAQRL